MSDERHYILGTAGHIDHGKSSLVRALTGTDPDRLPEEQRRGVTIELGFAHLSLPAPGQADTIYELGIVDVPGHADFVNNMVAGVGGMDLALFVVAADDGWMPQSEEHLHILTYLGITRGLIALTKSDLAEDLEFSIEFVRDSLRGSTFAEAPILPVSSLTGAGLEDLKAALGTQLAQAPPQRDFGKPILPVDRAFSVKGIGTVITGTLSGGILKVGDRLALQPDGTVAHVRAIQNHSRFIDSASPGMRTALNLPELPVSARHRPGARRGTILTTPGAGTPSDTINLAMQRLGREIPGQLATRRALPSGRRVRVHHGSGSCGARIYIVEERSIAPGEAKLAQLRLDEPRFMMIGDHVVIRDWSGEATLGGGVVLESEARRRGLRNDEQVRFLQARAAAPNDLPTIIESALERDCYLRLAGLKSRLRFSEAEFEAAVTLLVESESARRIGDSLALASWWDALLTRAADLVGAYHKKNADLPGIPLADLRAALLSHLPKETLFDLVLHHLGERGIVQRGTLLAEESFQPSLPDEIRAAAESLERALRQEPLNPPSRGELATDPSSRRALSFLIRSGVAIDLGDKTVILGDAYRQACDTILAHLRTEGQATASDLRQLIDTSRRIIMPLLERMDTDGLTRRNGDFRIAL